MIRINEHYLKLQDSYLFANIAKRVGAFQKEHPEREIIRLGIGDVTRALPPACIAAFHRAIDEMAQDSTFHGYGPEQGYEFLREKIARWDFIDNGAQVEADEVFVSDGAKCDTGNLQEIFATDIKVAIPDPVYPVYLDTNVMAGRTGVYKNGRYQGVTYLNCTAANDYIPQLPPEPVDLIYLCFPNNPTGATISREQLKLWVDYAHEHHAIILFDAAYEAFIRDDRLPHSIYEVDGAREVAIEFRSFPKPPVLPARAVPIPWCPNHAAPIRPPGGPLMFTHCGIGVIPPSSTAYPIRCKKLRKRFSRPRARPRSGN